MTKRIGILGVSLSLLLSNAASANIGVFRGLEDDGYTQGMWYLDLNGNNVWDGTPTDMRSQFGLFRDLPLVHTFNCNSGINEIFVVRGQDTWFWSWDNYSWDSPPDQTFTFGHFADGSQAQPVSFNGHIGAFSNGTWVIDTNNTHAFESPGDAIYSFGLTNDTPVVGRWGSGPTQKLGVLRWINNLPTFFLDLDGSNSWTSGDGVYTWSVATGLSFPVVSDFNPRHPGDEFALFDQGTWYVDFNGNRLWDGESGGDKIYHFGTFGDLPVATQYGQPWTDYCVL
jgi:hypothetical protein